VPPPRSWSALPGSGLHVANRSMSAVVAVIMGR
jgi:hypothetical protein